MCFNTTAVALAGVAQLVGILSSNRKAAGSIPSLGTYLGCRFDPPLAPVQVRVIPSSGVYGRQPIDVSLSPFLSPFLSL